MTIDLWPPLDHLRSAFAGGRARAPEVHEERDGSVAVPSPHERHVPRRCEADSARPLTELARRREALAARAFPARWAPGRLVSVLHDGMLLGVLLDRRGPGEAWLGWMAAGEPDWAGVFDVLLEPEDEPFEPMFGLVQAWNVLALAPSPSLCARVVGEVSAQRLAAIRAVHDEWAAGEQLDIASEPGAVALRGAGGGAFTVLTGTPLAPADPRGSHQALYRELADRAGWRLQLSAPSVERRADAEPAPAAAPAPQADSGWRRVRQWFAADHVLRPAFAALLLVVVVQQIGMRGGGSAEDDAVRFRSMPGAVAPAPAAGVPSPAAAVPASFDLVVRWKPGVAWDDAADLLRTLPAEVVGGPDAQGAWRLRTPDAAVARVVLRTSALVASVVPADAEVGGGAVPASAATTAVAK